MGWRAGVGVRLGPVELSAALAAASEAAESGMRYAAGLLSAAGAVFPARRQRLGANNEESAAGGLHQYMGTLSGVFVGTCLG